MSDSDWLPGNPNDRSVYGWRIRHGGSHGPMGSSKYHQLKKEGRGPRETIIGGKILITVADEAAWDKSPPKGDEPKHQLDERAEGRRERAKKAAAAAILSPLHISNVRRRKSQAAA